MSEQNDTTVIITDEIKKSCEFRGRPKKYDDVKLHLKDTKYHQQYYHMTNKDLECDVCGKKTTTRALKQHQRSLYCLAIRDYKIKSQSTAAIPA
jgi:hypothetical protein